jgi:hypothetical protein
MPPRLSDRLTFQSRDLDANNDPLGDFVDRFTKWADLDYQRGSESATGNRLQGQQPATIVVRDSAETRTITPGFCAVVVVPVSRAGETFNITAVAPAKDPGYLNLMAMSGVAPG